MLLQDVFTKRINRWKSIINSDASSYVSVGYTVTETAHAYTQVWAGYFTGTPWQRIYDEAPCMIITRPPIDEHYIRQFVEWQHRRFLCNKDKH